MKELGKTDFLQTQEVNPNNPVEGKTKQPNKQKNMYRN